MQWSPFRKPGFNIVWQGDSAQVWTWDEALRQQQASSGAARNTAPVAETRFYQPPEADSVRLVRCLEGVEGQIWKNGLLQESHWWAEPPGAEGWANFLRSAGHQSGASLPVVQSLPQLKYPWGRARGVEDGLLTSAEGLVWRTGLLIGLFLFGWNAMELYQINQAATQLQQDIAISSSGVEPLLQAREQALQAQQQAVQARALWPQYSQLQLMDAVLTALPQSEKLQLAEWLYEPGQLSFVIAGRQLDPSILIRKYQGLEWAHEVTAEQGRSADKMRINIKLRPGGQSGDAATSL